MRINKYVALATGMSRRAADAAISEGRVLVNGNTPQIGQDIITDDAVTLDKALITPAVKRLTLILNKPTGYVVSRNGQGSKTIYDLLPPEYQQLKPVGRLDKDSSGLLLLTNDGNLANELTHPKYQKIKIYEIKLNKPLTPEDKAKLDKGILLEDGPSNLTVIWSAVEQSLDSAPDDKQWTIKMQEGRNRQIRRTFATLGYEVTKLHRTLFGPYVLEGLSSGAVREAKS